MCSVLWAMCSVKCVECAVGYIVHTKGKQNEQNAFLWKLKFQRYFALKLFVLNAFLMFKIKQKNGQIPLSTRQLTKKMKVNLLIKYIIKM